MIGAGDGPGLFVDEKGPAGCLAPLIFKAEPPFPAFCCARHRVPLRYLEVVSRAPL
jgi:hypothetical protein